MEDRGMQFEDLDAWKLARKFVVEIYKLTNHENLSREFAIKDQIQRASISVMNNIAEGFERISKPEKKHFYSIARASCGEVRSMLYLVEDLHPSLQNYTQQYREQTVRLGKLISGLIRSTEARIAQGK